MNIEIIGTLEDYGFMATSPDPSGKQHAGMITIRIAPDPAYPRDPDMLMQALKQLMEQKKLRLTIEPYNG
jgi:hypothetical protein